MQSDDRLEPGVIGQQLRRNFPAVVQAIEEFPLVRLEREDEGEQVLALSEQTAQGSRGASAAMSMGCPVSAEYSTSGSRSAPFGHTTVPSSA